MNSSIRKFIKLILEAEATVPMLPGPKRDPFAGRSYMMQDVARQVAERLDLSDVRFLARSKRPTGAYTFSAVDDRNENVVLKIQPLNELRGYAKLQAMSIKLPKEVNRHLPFIKTVRTLEELGITAQSDPLLGPEPLGVIVMERLENLPGNMFDLITEPPLQSARSLSALISDRETLRTIIEKTISSSSHILSRFFSDYGRVHSNLMNDLIERLMLLSTRARRIVNPEGDKNEEFYNLREVIVEIANQWYDNVEAWVKENQDELDLDPKTVNAILGRGLRGMTIAAISSNFTNQLSKRAIPISPGESKAGSLSSLAGIKELRDAIEHLRKAGVYLDDIHGNNIMIRPETGELVLSDLGHFR